MPPSPKTAILAPASFFEASSPNSISIRENASCILRPVFGLGGVGSYVLEGLARCGVGSLTLVDHDTVSETNINRQLYALRSTVGKSKVQVAKERIWAIYEGILVNTYETFYNE